MESKNYYPIRRISKLISALLAIVMTAVLLPIGEIKAAEDFDVYVYMADNILSSETTAGKRLNSYLNNKSTLAEVWQDNVTDEFKNSVTVWETANLILSPNDAADKAIDAKGYYISVILTMMKSSFKSDTVLGKIDSSGIVKGASKLYNGFASFYKEANNADLDDFLKQGSWTAEEADAMRATQKKWMKENSMSLSVGDALNDIFFVLDTAEDMQECCDMFASFCMVNEIGAEWKSCLNYMYNNCDKSNYPLYSALKTLVDVANSEEWGGILTEVWEYGAEKVGATFYSYAIDALIDGLVGELPVIKGMQIGQTIGKGISNMLFGTDKTCEAYHIVTAYCDVLDLFKGSFYNVRNTYLKNKTPENAKAFLSYVDMYFSVLVTGNDLGQDFADVLYSGGILSKLFTDVETYKQLTENNANNTEYMHDAHKHITLSWIYDLLTDNAEMYEVYATLLSASYSDFDCYVSRIEFEKESVEWGLSDSIFEGYEVTVYPENADCKDVEYSSSDKSVAYIDNRGYVHVVGVGTCIITAASVDFCDVTDTLAVTVVEGDGADSSTIELVPITPTVPEDDDFEYTISDGKVTITDYYGERPNVIIPDTIEGYPVTEIGSWAFYNCTSLTSITIPDSVTAIGTYAFYKCTSLTSITIPDSVTSIGDSAFCSCTSLTSITIPDSVTYIGDSAFYKCSSLASITIPDSVTSIGHGTFEDCISLTSITIPDSVTYIGCSTFEDCISLTSITIPDSVTTIYGSAFYNCTGLISITIPDSVTTISTWAFVDCTSLTSITIPDSVTSIGNYTFQSCTSLASITIPDSVTSIGDYAFYDCSSLTSMTIPDSVTSIGEGTFYKCSSLASITIPDSITYIGEWTFVDCTNLTNITIPDSVTSIGYYVFGGCTSLTSITIPDSVTFISVSAFNGCPNLTIYGYSGSYAESYAKDKDIPFVALAEKVQKPTITKAAPSDGKVALNWTAVDGASKYAVYTYVNGRWTCAGTRTELGMYVDGLTNGTKYGFAVKAYVNGAWTEVTSADIVYATPVGASKPKITSVEVGDGKIGLNWTSVSGATKYAVYVNSGSGWNCAGTRTALGMYVNGLTNGTKYGFAVKAYVNNAWTEVTSSDIVYATPVSASKPKITSVEVGDGKIGLNWTSVSGATKYAVYVNSGSGWNCAGTRTALGMYVNGLTNGTKYGFAVKAYVNNAWTSVTSSDIVYATPVSASKPTITKAIAGNGRVALNWTAVSGAEKYAIYTYVNGKYTCVGSRASTVTGMYVTGLTNGTKYGFLVRAYINGAWTSFTTADIVYATPSASVAASDISFDETNYVAPVIL